MNGPKIIGVSYGNPWDLNTWSNNPYYLFNALKQKGILRNAWGRNIFKNELRWAKLLAVLKFKTLKKAEIGNLANRYFISKKLGREFKEFLSNTTYDKNDVIISTSSFIDFDGIDIPFYLYGDTSFADFYLNYPGAKRLISKKVAKKIFDYEIKQINRAKKIFTFSQWAKQSLITNYGTREEKIDVVGHGYCLPDVENFDKKKIEKPWILFVSTNWHKKGGDIVLQAFNLVKEKYKNYELHIIGRVPYQILKENISGLVYHGFLNKNNKKDVDKMIELYKRASIFVLPSLFDPMPNITLEANYFKTPVIASNVCGIPEQVIDGKTGFIINEQDSEKYAQKIELLINNEWLRYEMGESGRVFVKENFSWDSVIHNIQKNIN